MIRDVAERRVFLYRQLRILAGLLALALIAGLVTIRVPAPLPRPQPIPVVPPVQRVGIQSGHWNTWDVPDELSALRTSVGAHESDWAEFIVNLEVSRRVAEILRREGVEVDLLPVTLPQGYQADLFVSIHGDYNSDRKASGFKVARSDWAENPDRDDTLVNTLLSSYAAATGLVEHRGSYTDNMTQYYAFNQKYRHSVKTSTPSVLVELGFLTNDRDRRLLTEEPDRAAQGVAQGILNYLHSTRESRE